MGKSFVLRDADAHICGYLIFAKGQVICRFHALVEDMQLCLMTVQGEIVRHELPSDGDEHVWTDGGFIFTDGAVCTGKHVLADTGEAIRRTLDEAQRRMQTTERPLSAQRTREPEETSPQRHEAEPETAEEEAHVRVAQRRWPPPVLMEDARYHAGCWTLADDEHAEQTL